MINTLSITKARQELPTLVDNADKKLDEYIITVNGSPTAVLISAKEYDSWKETVNILSDPELISSIKASEEALDEGKGIAWENVKKQLSWD